MKYFAALLATATALNWNNRAAMIAWLEDHTDALSEEDAIEIKYDVSAYGTTVEFEYEDPGIDVIIQLDNLPDGATLKYYEASLEVLGYTTAETLDGKRTAFIAICTPGDEDHVDEHGHGPDHVEGDPGTEVYQLTLSDSVTCTAASTMDCTNAEKL